MAELSLSRSPLDVARRIQAERMVEEGRAASVEEALAARPEVPPWMAGSAMPSTLMSELTPTPFPTQPASLAAPRRGAAIESAARPLGRAIVPTSAPTSAFQSVGPPADSGTPQDNILRRQPVGLLPRSPLDLPPDLPRPLSASIAAERRDTEPTPPALGRVTAPGAGPVFPSPRAVWAAGELHRLNSLMPSAYAATPSAYAFPPAGPEAEAIATEQAARGRADVLRGPRARQVTFEGTGGLIKGGPTDASLDAQGADLARRERARVAITTPAAPMAPVAGAPDAPVGHWASSRPADPKVSAILDAKFRELFPPGERQHAPGMEPGKTDAGAQITDSRLFHPAVQDIQKKLGLSDAEAIKAAEKAGLVNAAPVQGGAGGDRLVPTMPAGRTPPVVMTPENRQTLIEAARANRQLPLSQQRSLPITVGRPSAPAGQAPGGWRSPGEFMAAGRGEPLAVTGYTDNPDGTTTHRLSDGSTERVRLVRQPDGTMAVFDLNGRNLSGPSGPTLSPEGAARIADREQRLARAREDIYERGRSAGMARRDRLGKTPIPSAMLEAGRDMRDIRRSEGDFRRDALSAQQAERNALIAGEQRNRDREFEFREREANQRREDAKLAAWQTAQAAAMQAESEAAHLESTRRNTPEAMEARRRANNARAMANLVPPPAGIPASAIVAGAGFGAVPPPAAPPQAPGGINSGIDGVWRGSYPTSGTQPAAPSGTPVTNPGTPPVATALPPQHEAAAAAAAQAQPGTPAWKIARDYVDRVGGWEAYRSNPAVREYVNSTFGPEAKRGLESHFAWSLGGPTFSSEFNPKEVSPDMPASEQAKILGRGLLDIPVTLGRLLAAPFKQ